MDMFNYLEGRKMCIVYVQVVDPSTEKVRLQCFRGRANVKDNQIEVIDDNGVKVPIPQNALRNILPSDGTPILKDAEFFVMVRVSDNIDLVNQNDAYDMMNGKF